MIETLKIGTLKWIYIYEPTDKDMSFISESYHFHPLDIEDCKSRTNQRPKIDVYDDYYFLILHFPHFDRTDKFLKVREVKIFWGEDYIITIGRKLGLIRDIFDGSKDEKDLYNIKQVGTSDTLLYKIIEQLMSDFLSLLRKISIEVDLINRDLFSKKAERTIERISVTRKNIIIINTIIKPQLKVFQKFETGEIEGYAENMEEYWSNILDYYQKIFDITEDCQEIIEGLSKTFDSLQTNKTNEIMKVLTLISSILLPLTFIASLYGMNVGLPFQEENHAFWTLMFMMIGLASLMILYFKRKRWM